MGTYLATFHTHLSAMLTCQALRADGVPARMMPVPRVLSSSCGTCVRYTADADRRQALDRDWEALYVEEHGQYRCIRTAEDGEICDSAQCMET